MAVLAIEAEATLLVMPGEAGEAAFDRRDREGSERRLWGALLSGAAQFAM